MSVKRFHCRKAGPASITPGEIHVLASDYDALVAKLEVLIAKSADGHQYGSKMYEEIERIIKESK